MERMASAAVPKKWLPLFQCCTCIGDVTPVRFGRWT
jgi:hypothetical protein